MALPRGGKRKGEGRPKGAHNIVARQLKDMILNTLDTAGGEKYLLKIAKEDPKTFATLLGRVLPMTVAGDNNEDPVNIATTIKLVAGGRDRD